MSKLLMQTIGQWVYGEDTQENDCDEQPSLASSITSESASCCSFDFDGLSPIDSCNDVDDNGHRQKYQQECDSSIISLSDQQLPAAPTFDDTYQLLSDSDSYLGDGISAKFTNAYIVKHLIYVQSRSYKSHKSIVMTVLDVRYHCWSRYLIRISYKCMIVMKMRILYISLLLQYYGMHIWIKMFYTLM